MKAFMQKNWHIVAYLVGPLLLILGIFINSMESKTLSGLQETSGKILATEISSSAGRKARYSPVVKYSYEVNGTKYENNRIGLARFNYDSREDAQEILDKYPVGKTVPVFYFAENPQTAYLDKDEMGNGEMLIYLSIFEMLFFTPVIWFIKRRLSMQAAK